MAKEILVLHDNTEIELEAGARLGALQVLSADKAAMVAVWDRLTPVNLATVQIKGDDGRVIASYTDLVLGDPAITAVHVNPDRSILTTFYIRPKTELELLADRVAAVEDTTDVLTMEALNGGEA